MTVVNKKLTRAKFDYELKYLLWFFEKKLKMGKSKSSAAKYLNSILNQLEKLKIDDKDENLDENKL